VGRRIAGVWNMPAKLQVCLAGAALVAGPAADQSLASITDYSRDLAYALYRKGAGLDSVHLRTVVDPHGSQLLISVRDLRRLIDLGVTETKETFSGLGIPLEKLRLERQAEDARDVLASSPVFDAAKLDVLDRTVASVDEGLGGGDFDLPSQIAAVLDAMCAAGFDRAVFALVNEARTFVRGRVGTGAGAAELRDRFQFPLAHAEGPILAALVRRTDVLVDRARDDRYDASGLVTEFKPAAFALFPLVTDRRAIGCVYADRAKPSPGLNAARPSIGRARDTIAKALRKKSTR